MEQHCEYCLCAPTTEVSVETEGGVVVDAYAVCEWHADELRTML